MDRRYDSAAAIAVRMGEIAAALEMLGSEWQEALQEFKDADAAFEVEMARARLAATGTVADKKDAAIEKNIKLFIHVSECETRLEICKTKYKVLDREASTLQSLLSKEREEMKMAGLIQ